MKRIISLGSLSIVMFLILTGCNNSNNTLGGINVISREDGSGTRGAFIELVGILEENKDGEKEDRTYEEAIIQNGTNSVITSIEGDINSIGYISVGSLKSSVKTLKVDGAKPTVENIKNETYKISRAFNIAYGEKKDELTKDFIEFLSSNEAQDIVESIGYIKIQPNGEYKGKDISGNLVIAGSTSVTPVMEKLSEEYKRLNPEVSIEIQSTGSSAGIQAVIEESADIGMASRELDTDEKEKLSFESIAIDGIAVIVNTENSLENIKLKDLRSVYIGEITDWDKLK